MLARATSFDHTGVASMRDRNRMTLEAPLPMAKRTRGSNRPGQRHSARNAPARPQPRPVLRAGEELSNQEEARSSEVEPQAAAPVRASEAGFGRPRDRVRAGELDRSSKARTQGLLAARGAEEYGYVVRDVRRILRVGGLMAAALAVFFVLIDVMHVIKV